MNLVHSAKALGPKQLNLNNGVTMTWMTSQSLQTHREMLNMAQAAASPAAAVPG